MLYFLLIKNVSVAEGRVWNAVRIGGRDRRSVKTRILVVRSPLARWH